MSVPATTFRAVDDVDQLLDQVCRRGRQLKRLRAGLDKICYPRHDWFETFKTISASPAAENPRELPSWHALEQGDVPTAEGSGISERVATDAALARQHAAAHFLKSERWESGYAAPLLAVIERVQARAVWSFGTLSGRLIVCTGVIVLSVLASLLHILLTVLVIVGAIATVLLLRESLTAVGVRRENCAASIKKTVEHLRRVIKQYGRGELPRGNFLTELDFAQSMLASSIDQSAGTWYGKLLTRTVEGMRHEIPAIADVILLEEDKAMRRAAAVGIAAAVEEAAQIRSLREARKRDMADAALDVRTALKALPAASEALAQQRSLIAGLLESAALDLRQWQEAACDEARAATRALASIDGQLLRQLEVSDRAMKRLGSTSRDIADITLGEDMARSVFTPELSSAMARGIAERDAFLGGLQSAMEAIASERNWSLAVADMDGPIAARIRDFDARPGEYDGQRILRYAHRDVIRLGYAAEGLTAHGERLPFLLRLRALEIDEQVDPRVSPAVHERSLVIAARDRTAVELADAMVRQLSFRSLGLRQPGDLHLSVIDPIRAGGSMRQVGQLVGVAFEPKDLAVDQQSIDSLLRNLRQEMTRKILHNLGSEAHTIDSRVSDASSGPIHFRTLCVFGYPRGFDESSIAELEQLCRTGDQVGIHVFVSMDVVELERALVANPKVNPGIISRSAAQIYVKDPGSRELVMELESGAEGRSEVRFTMDRLWSAAELDRFIRAFRHDYQCRDISRISPVEAAQSLREKGGGTLPDVAREASLVLGTESGNTAIPVDIPFGRDIAHHALLVGATGSGKTRLLQAIVAGACINYSPDELEFWLLDFKSGTGFKPFAEAKVPHCRVIGLSSDVTYGLDALQKLVDEMGRRQVLFKQSSVENLEQYASLQRRSEGTMVALPRVIAIIDEFQLLFGRESATMARVRMAQIVQKGRSAGMHLFLATQAIEGQAADIDAFRSQIKVNVILQSSSSTQRSVIDSEDRGEYRKLRRFEGLLDVNGRQTVFDVLDMPDRPDQPNVNLRVALDAVTRQWGTERPSMVYDGESSMPLPPLDVLREMAREASAEDHDLGVPLVLGIAAAVTRAPAHAFLHTAMNGNVVMSITDERVAEAQLAAAILSMCASPEVQALEVDILQADRLGRTWREMSKLIPEHVVMRHHDTAVSIEAIGAIAAGLTKRDAGSRHLVISREWTVLKPFADSGGFSDEATLVTRILSEGPILGTHAVAITTTGRKLMLDARDKYGVRIASAGSAELASSQGFNPTAFGRLFVETPSRPDTCIEYIPFS